MKDKIFTLLEIVEKSVAFNKSLDFSELKNVYLATDSKTLLEIFILRSKIYKQMGYDKEFPDPIESFNFDEHDMHSAILYTKTNGKITGTLRLIFDSDKQLPIDKNYSFDYLRDKNNKLVELSRLVIQKPKNGLNKDFQYLTKGVYYITKLNNISHVVSVMVPEHTKIYKKFGGFTINKELNSYDKLNQPFMITTWQNSNPTPLFKKVFLQ